ncbi:MAG: LLM class flavin-dependent oxidoreductase, partial [Acidimicrobiia bacterium]|nr:LLM class flavin-dependent oxidoreductase [Acidimicrobiia bacterium]
MSSDPGPQGGAIPSPALVVLIGPSSAGKTSWAQENFRPGQVLSSDDFRALCGAGPDDQTAGTEAFALLDQILEIRLAKRLTTVVDTLGLDDGRRRAYRQAAQQARMGCVAVGFDTDSALCHERNRNKARPLPKSVLDRQIRQWRQVRDRLDEEGFDLLLLNPGPTHQVAAHLADDQAAPTAATDGPSETTAGRSRPEIDLVVSRYAFGDADFASTLVDIAAVAERVGFRALWVMDHFRQIPQVGRPWEPMLEPYTTLAYLAASTSRLRLGTLVTGVEHRNVGLLAKIVATLDVLSGGRAECGLGAGWFDAEQAAYGYPVNSNRRRLDTLEDVLQALPLLWGPGAKSFTGKVLSIPEALAYPRPVQDPVPILVGGGGEKRTLWLAAAYADACNVIGTEPAVVAHKIEVV